MDRDCAILEMSKDGRKGSGSRDLTWVMIPEEENCAIEKGWILKISRVFYCSFHGWIVCVYGWLLVNFAVAQSVIRFWSIIYMIPKKYHKVSQQHCNRSAKNIKSIDTRSVFWQSMGKRTDPLLGGLFFCDGWYRNCLVIIFLMLRMDQFKFDWREARTKELYNVSPRNVTDLTELRKDEWIVFLAKKLNCCC